MKSILATALTILITYSAFTTWMIFTALPQKYRAINPDIEPYILAFKTQANKRDIDVNINTIQASFSSNLTNMWGVCKHPSLFNSPRIYINRAHWDTAPGYSYKNELIIFHELGHCILNKKGHKKGNNDIMRNPPVPTFYIKYRKQSLDRFFLNTQH